MSKALILYVEDEEDDLFFMHRAFKPFAESVVLHSARHGKEAMAYLAGHGCYSAREQYPMPDVVLLDLNLPIIPGFEVLKWIREQPTLAALKVIVFSSSGRADDIARARALGSDDYLLKPTSALAFADVARQIHSRWITGLAAKSATESAPLSVPATP